MWGQRWPVAGLGMSWKSLGMGVWGWKCIQEAALRDLEIKPIGLGDKLQPRGSETGV